MRVVVLEPLGVSQERLAGLAAPLGEAGHKVEFYATRERNWAVMAERASDADVVVIANHAPQGGRGASLPQPEDDLRGLHGGGPSGPGGLPDPGHPGVQRRRVRHLRGGGADPGPGAGPLPADPSGGRGGPKRRHPGGAAPAGLRGKTFGVVGTGAIGKEVARLAAAFGCSVLGHRRSVPEGAEEEGILHVSLEDLLRRSDLVSLRAPHRRHPRPDREEALALMKPDGVLINVARGPVVDQQALARALREGRLGGAGVDVFDLEPPLPPDHVLFEVPRLILTPHLGYATEEALEERARIALENVLAWTLGRPRNVVCP